MTIHYTFMYKIKISSGKSFKNKYQYKVMTDRFINRPHIDYNVLYQRSNLFIIDSKSCKHESIHKPFTSDKAHDVSGEATAGKDTRTVMSSCYGIQV